MANNESIVEFTKELLRSSLIGNLSYNFSILRFINRSVLQQYLGYSRYCCIGTESDTDFSQVRFPALLPVK